MICYLGDDDLNGAAGYLAAVLGHAGVRFHHIPSRRKVPGDLAFGSFQAFVLSDYPASGFSTRQLAELAGAVSAGAGLAMIGGWESFYGRTGEYRGTVLEKVLPVYLSHHDDRVNCPQGCVIRQVRRHPILDGLSWQFPPVVAGFNRLTAKPEARTLAVGLRLRIEDRVRDLRFSEAEVAPMLIVGRYDQGRTAALACDVAPHWVGGMVDWGQGRIVQHLPDGGFVEFGPAYAEFLYRLMVWVSRGTDWADWYQDDILTAPEEDIVEAAGADAGPATADSR